MTSLSQGRTAAAQCGLFTHKSVPVIFEPPCTFTYFYATYQWFYNVPFFKTETTKDQVQYHFKVHFYDIYTHTTHTHTHTHTHFTGLITGSVAFRKLQ